MPRRREVPKREILPDPVYNSQLVTKFINSLMDDGKKSVAESVFYGAMKKVEDRAKDQIEYVNEDKWVREKFESELAQRGLTSLMPPEAYTDPSFEWNWSPFLRGKQGG